MWSHGSARLAIMLLFVATTCVPGALTADTLNRDRFAGTWVVTALEARDGHPRVGTSAIVTAAPSGYRLQFADTSYVWHLQGEGPVIASAPGSSPYLTLMLSSNEVTAVLVFRPDGKEPRKRVILRRQGAGAAQVGDPGISVLRATGDTRQYLVVDGRRRHLPDAKSKVALGLGAMQAQVVSREVLEAIPAGPELASQEVYVVKGSGPEQYLLVQGWRRYIPDPETKIALKLAAFPLYVVPDDWLEMYPELTPFPSTRSGPGAWVNPEIAQQLLSPDEPTRLRIKRMREEMRRMMRPRR